MKVKKKGFIAIALLALSILVMSLPSDALASPMMNRKEEITVFNGRWFATRLAHGREIAERLKIECNKNKEICRVELTTDWSNSCTTSHGEETGAMLKGKGPVVVAWPRITINVDAYCLTKPPTYSGFPLDIWFEYNETDNTLLDNIGVMWHRGK
jgi:hypothetical protein